MKCRGMRQDLLQQKKILFPESLLFVLTKAKKYYIGIYNHKLFTINIIIIIIITVSFNYNGLPG